MKNKDMGIVVFIEFLWLVPRHKELLGYNRINVLIYIQEEMRWKLDVRR